MLFGVQYFLWMLAVYASPPPSPAVDARLATGLRAADFPDRTFTGNQPQLHMAHSLRIVGQVLTFSKRARFAVMLSEYRMPLGQDL